MNDDEIFAHPSVYIEEIKQLLKDKAVLVEALEEVANHCGSKHYQMNARMIAVANQALSTIKAGEGRGE
jgi:hypothetical protein